MPAYVLVEYPEPTAPHNRRLFDCGGPLVMEMTPAEAADYQQRLGADSQFRVYPLEVARKVFPELREAEGG